MSPSPPSGPAASLPAQSAGAVPTGPGHDLKAGAGPIEGPPSVWPASARIAWGLTGSGHLLEESLALAATLPGVDLFLSPAAEEVLSIYGLGLASLRERFRVFRDKTASSVPVGQLYDHGYHTMVIAPATSNTVAKCAFGLSDTLPTNMFAQAGKLMIPSIVLACDTRPTVITRGPHRWLSLHPRRIELDNVERLKAIDYCTVVETVDALEAALRARLADLRAAATAKDTAAAAAAPASHDPATLSTTASPHAPAPSRPWNTSSS